MADHSSIDPGNCVGCQQEREGGAGDTRHPARHRLSRHVGRLDAHDLDDLRLHSPVDRHGSTNRNTHGSLGTFSEAGQSDPRCDADHAEFRLSDPGRDAARHWQGSRTDCRGHLRDTADDPAHQSRHPPCRQGRA
ncbi:hypothetical protein D9M70_510750 [compost metagenome]